MFILIMICVTLFILTSSQFRVYTILNSLTKLPSPIITWSHTTHHFIALSTINLHCQSEMFRAVHVFVHMVEYIKTYQP